jgi:hypothetical protein
MSKIAASGGAELRVRCKSGVKVGFLQILDGVTLISYREPGRLSGDAAIGSALSALGAPCPIA